MVLPAMIGPEDLPDFESHRRAVQAELESLLELDASSLSLGAQLRSFVERSLQDRRVARLDLFVPNVYAGRAAAELLRVAELNNGDPAWDRLRCFALVFRSRGVRNGAKLRLADRQQAERVARELRDPYWLGYALKWQADETAGWKNKVELLRAAADSFKLHAVTVAHDKNLRVDVARETLSSLTSLAMRFRANGQFEEVVRLLDEGEQIDPGGILCPDGLANLYRAVGVACRMYGDMAQWRAITSMIDSIGIGAAQRGDERGSASCRRIFAQTQAVAEYVYYGNCVRALELLREAQDLVVNHGVASLSALVDLLNSECSVRRLLGPERGDFERALIALEMARDVKRFYQTAAQVSVQRLKEAQLLAVWGRPGDIDKARQLVRESVNEGESTRSGKQQTRLLLASLSEPGDVEALGHIDLVIARASVNRSGYRRLTEARACRAEWFARAGAQLKGTDRTVMLEIAAEEAIVPLKEFERFDDWRNVARLRTLRAECLSVQDSAEVQRIAFHDALAAIEAGERAIRSIAAPDDRSWFFASFRPTVACALRLAASINEPRGALRVHESVRSAGLVEMLLSGGAALPEVLRNEWENLLASRVEAHRVLSETPFTIDTNEDPETGPERQTHRKSAWLPAGTELAQQAFARAFGTSAVLLTELSHPDVETLEGVFPDACVLSFQWVGSEANGQLFRWWRLPDGQSGCDVVSPQERQLYWLCGPHRLSDAAWNHVLLNDGELLLPLPIRSWLVAHELNDLVIAPNGALWTFPWPGLTLAGRPLVASTRVRLVPSLWAAHALQRPADTESHIGVQGVFDKKLKGARSEREGLQMLQSTLGELEELPTNVDLVLRRLDPQSKVVTFAVHGELSGGGLDQALVLGDQPEEVLLAGHLFLTNLPRIVVAGACWSTSVNDRDFDPVGLPHASLSRGARSYVGGVFGIHDQTTGEVLTRFYTLLGNGVEAVEALRQAQLAQWLLDPHHSQFATWSGLVIISVETPTNTPESQPPLPGSG